MKQTWNEPILMTVLSLLCMAAVLGVGHLFETDRDLGDKRSPSSTRQSNDNNNTRDKLIVRKLDQLESTVRSLEAQSATTDPLNHRQLQAQDQIQTEVQAQGQDSIQNEGAVFSPTMKFKPASEREALVRGWQYVASQEYDPRSHDRILSYLVSSYAEKGLSPEMNRSLLATIEQVNEIGVDQVTKDAQLLPAPTAVEKLEKFIKTTPKLTKGQRARINLALSTAEGKGKAAFN